MRRPRPTSLRARAFRAGLVALVLAGYLAALGATASGRGLALGTHLVLAHGERAPATPGLVGEATVGGDVLTTLRPDVTHRHGDHVHSHEPDGETPAPALFPERGAVRVSTEAEPGAHEHDGRFHRHDAPPREPRLVLTVSLDKHRLPPVAAVPAPPALQLADLGGPEGALDSVDLSVETPPPLRRG